MKIITICGMIKSGSAKYVLDSKLPQEMVTLSEKSYVNMLPLLVDAFAPNRSVVAIATTDAKNVQWEVLQNEKIDPLKVTFVEVLENDFEKYFATINSLISDADEVIIDLSHGFRHLPLLTLVALIIQNLKHHEKIKHILFAQEVEKYKEYKVIDLIEYLDLATISYALVSFRDNYTIATSLHPRTSSYAELLRVLQELSHHILANSISKIFDDRLPAKILDKIEALEESDANIKTLSGLLDEIKMHLKWLDDLSPSSHYVRLYELGKILLGKGYLLNAITILNEAIPIYVFEHLKRIGLGSTDTHKPYDISSAVIAFLKKGTLNPKILPNIHTYYRCSHSDTLDPLAQLQEEARVLRNDLAHAYGATVQEDISEQLQKIYAQFEALIMGQNCAKALTNIYNEKEPKCRYQPQIFEEFAQKVFFKYFKTEGFKNLFKEKRIEKLFERDEDSLKVWHISARYSSNQEQILALLYEYENAKNVEESEIHSIMDKFYTKFS